MKRKSFISTILAFCCAPFLPKTAASKFITLPGTFASCLPIPLSSTRFYLPHLVCQGAVGLYKPETELTRMMAEIPEDDNEYRLVYSNILDLELNPSCDIGKFSIFKVGKSPTGKRIVWCDEAMNLWERDFLRFSEKAGRIYDFQLFSKCENGQTTFRWSDKKLGLLSPEFQTEAEATIWRTEQLA